MYYPSRLALEGSKEFAQARRQNSALRQATGKVNIQLSRGVDKGRLAVNKKGISCQERTMSNHEIRRQILKKLEPKVRAHLRSGRGRNRKHSGAPEPRMGNTPNGTKQQGEGGTKTKS